MLCLVLTVTSLAICASYSHSETTETVSLAVSVHFCLIVCIQYEGPSKETLIALVMTELACVLVAVITSLLNTFFRRYK